MRHWTLEGRCLTAATVATSARLTADNAPDDAVLSYIATKDLISAIEDLTRITERFSDPEHVRELRRAIERVMHRDAAE